MPQSIGEMLRREMECDGLLDCFHGLKELDQQCFEVLSDAEDPLTVDEVAEIVDRERSTAYRSLQRLVQAGVVQKEQVNYDDGGYYHVFAPTDPEEVSRNMQRMLNDWYAKMGQLIDDFEDEYEGPSPATTER